MNETKTKNKLAEQAQQRKRLAAAPKEFYLNVYWAKRHSEDIGDVALMTPLGPSIHVDLRQKFPCGEFTDGAHRLVPDAVSIGALLIANYPPPVYVVLLENEPPERKVVGGEGQRRIAGFEQAQVDAAKEAVANLTKKLDLITDPEPNGSVGPFTHLFHSMSGGVAKRFAREIQQNK